MAVGAALQASLLTQDSDFMEDSNITVQALNYDLVFLASGQDGQEDGDAEKIVLIPKQTPIPVRRSHHFPGGKDLISVKVYLRAEKKLLELTEVISVIYKTTILNEKNSSNCKVCLCFYTLPLSFDRFIPITISRFFC